MGGADTTPPPPWVKVVNDLLKAKAAAEEEEEAAASAASASAATTTSSSTDALAQLREDANFMDKYSRQIGAYGLEAMVKLVQMKVLIVGLRGVGIEVAKNTTLAGVHTMGLYDTDKVEIRDLGSNFFVTEKDVGKERGTVCVPKVQELNATVRVKEVKQLTEDVVSEYSAVVFTKGTRDELIKWNDFCRMQSPPIYFSSCFTGGAVGSVFVDCGPNHVIKDRDGREPLTKIVDDIEEKQTDDDGKPYYLVRYTNPEGAPPENLPEDGLIEFSDIGGMEYDGLKVDDGSALSLNNVHKVCTLRTYHDPNDPVRTVRLCLPDKDSEGNRVYISGLSEWNREGSSSGYMTEKKEPVSIHFSPLSESLKKPGGLIMAGDLATNGVHLVDMTFSMVELQLHVALQGVYAYQTEMRALPPPNNEKAIARVLELAKTFNEENKIVESVDEEVCKKVAAHASVELQPLCAFLGGIVSQELVKISGKYTPIMQWLNYHAFEALPDKPPTDTTPLGCRYDDQIVMYGKQFQEMIGDLKLFMVGCGALGCEFVKNFALMGVCCGPNGSLTITDNDRIEISNLNRQFLFRADNVGKPKSEAAASRAKTMNRYITIDSRQTFVAPSTEDIFDETFWMNLDLVCNALDNMQAREYVDARCVCFEKPLLESGTMGTGANVDVIVPHMTTSYTDGGNAEEGGGVPMCTLRNFPHLIDHCIEWSRAQFEDLFVTPAQEASQFLEDPEKFMKKVQSTTLDVKDASKIKQSLEPISNLTDSLSIAAKGPTIDGCVDMAWHLFHRYFRDKVVDLVKCFPDDATTKDGKPFWSGHKKFPVVIEFDKENDTHVEFLISATNLYASMLKVHGMKHASELNDPKNRWMAQYRDKEWLLSVVDKLGGPPEYVAGAVADLDEETTPAGAAATDDKEDEPAKLKALLDQLSTLSSAPNIFVPADFEKDDDDNFHIDFITACSNLRATNYRIPEAPREKAKMIAGRIIPAIATTTASVTGLVMLEMYKVLQSKPIDKLRNGNFNLGTNTYMMFEANPAVQKKNEVVITNPNPEEHPDAYDDKGQLTDMYKDPDMGLGFANWVKFHPNPHTKYDKFFVDDCSTTMTLGQLKDKVGDLFKESGLTMGPIYAPVQRIEITKDPDSDDKNAREGIGASGTILWHPQMKGTHANLDRKIAELILEKTTRTEDRPLLDPPVNIEGRRMFDGLTFTLIDDDGDSVETAKIYLKMVKFDFVPFKERKGYGEYRNGWLDDWVTKEKELMMKGNEVTSGELLSSAGGMGGIWCDVLNVCGTGTGTGSADDEDEK